MNTQKRYALEFQDRAVRLVEELQKEGSTQWAAMQSVSKSRAVHQKPFVAGFARVSCIISSSRACPWPGNAS